MMLSQRLTVWSSALGEFYLTHKFVAGWSCGTSHHCVVWFGYITNLLQLPHPTTTAPLLYKLNLPRLRVLWILLLCFLRFFADVLSPRHSHCMEAVCNLPTGSHLFLYRFTWPALSVAFRDLHWHWSAYTTHRAFWGNFNFGTKFLDSFRWAFKHRHSVCAFMAERINFLPRYRCFTLSTLSVEKVRRGIKKAHTARRSLRDGLEASSWQAYPVIWDDRRSTALRNNGDCTFSSDPTVVCGEEELFIQWILLPLWWNINSIYGLEKNYYSAHPQKFRGASCQLTILEIRSLKLWTSTYLVVLDEGKARDKREFFSTTKTIVTPGGPQHSLCLPGGGHRKDLHMSSYSGK